MSAAEGGASTWLREKTSAILLPFVTSQGADIWSTILKSGASKNNLKTVFYIFQATHTF